MRVLDRLFSEVISQDVATPRISPWALLCMLSFIWLAPSLLASLLLAGVDTAYEAAQLE